MEKLVFKQDVFEFTSPVKIESKNNRAEWEFTGDISLVDEMRPSCGCTTPFFDGNKVVAFYNAGKNPGTFEKRIFIYYKDGQPMTVKDSVSGNMIPNKNKERDILTLKGTQE